MIIDLPWPPTVNHYWGRSPHGHYYIKVKGIEYRRTVALLLKQKRVKTYEGLLNIEVLAYPPDHRNRNEDNIAKALFDALQHARLYDDDYQVAKHSFERMPVHKGGVVRLIIDEHEPSREEYCAL